MPSRNLFLGITPEQRGSFSVYWQAEAIRLPHMRIKVTNRPNLFYAVLWLVAAIAVISRGRASRWSAPYMTTTGAMAICFGVLCGVVGLIYLAGAFRRGSAPDEKHDANDSSFAKKADK
jgi:hypothetical protein